MGGNSVEEALDIHFAISSALEDVGVDAGDWAVASIFPTLIFLPFPVRKASNLWLWF